MKRSYVLMIAVVCFALGVGVSHFTTRRVKAQTQPSPVGRYQLFQGRYKVVGTNTSVEQNGVFKLDTMTGKTDQYFAGEGKDGKYAEGWSPIP